MTQSYNPNDFYPESGKEINSQGNVVNPADSVDAYGDQGIIINRHNQNTVQTHVGQSVLANGSTDSSWIDTIGFDNIGYTLLNDNVSTNSGLVVFWSNDGTNIHGQETILSSGAGQYRASGSATRARYLKVRVQNLDATNPHTMNAWAYLKS